MRWKSIFRRNFIALQVSTPFMVFIGSLYGLVLLSDGYVGSFFGVMAVMFCLMCLIPVVITELVRMNSAWLWKRGKWLSVAERKKIKYFASRY